MYVHISYIVCTHLIHKLHTCVHTILETYLFASYMNYVHHAGCTCIACTPDSADPGTSCPQMEVLRGRDGVPGTPGRDGSQGRDGRDGERGRRETQGQWVLLDHQGRRGDKAQQDCRDFLDPRDRLGFLAPVDQWGTKVIMAFLVCQGLKENREHRAHQQEGVWSTLAGGGPPVPVARELNLSTREKLEGLTTISMAEQLIFYVCQMILSTPRIMEQIIMFLSEELNIAQLVIDHFTMYLTTTCPVQCVHVHGTVLMIPAKLTCPTHWTTEYTGYLMAAPDHHNGRTLFECIDQQPESVPELNGHDVNDAHVEATCNSLSCPPYDTQKEVTCVVCSR